MQANQIIPPRSMSDLSIALAEYVSIATGVDFDVALDCACDGSLFIRPDGLYHDEREVYLAWRQLAIDICCEELIREIDLEEQWHEEVQEGLAYLTLAQEDSQDVA